LVTTSEGWEEEDDKILWSRGNERWKSTAREEGQGGGEGTPWGEGREQRGWGRRARPRAETKNTMRVEREGPFGREREKL